MVDRLRNVGRVAALVLSALLTACGSAVSNSRAAPDGVYQSDEHPFQVVTIAEGLENPWGLAFLPDGGMLVTERPGRLRLVRNGNLDPRPIQGLPEIAEYGQGGLLDVALHPRFTSNRLIYLSYAARHFDGFGTEVARGRLEGHRLHDVRVIFRALPKSDGGRHFGSRLLFAADGSLYVTLGDRGDRSRAQDLSDHAGSIVRLRDDGDIPADNPFVDRTGARPAIYTYGNRNVQGIALQPGSELIWAHEHGPRGGDELNLVKGGSNYGWPVMSYGREYISGLPVGSGTEQAGMEQPVHYWVPSIAPSGMTVYEGERFPLWRGDLFVGSLKFALLVRLEMNGEEVVREERMLQGVLGRIRAVATGPDGYLYLLSDESSGVLARLEPSGS